MDKFCGESFWDINKTWHTEVPDFTSCFQDIVLVTAPCSLFSILFFLSLWSLLSRSSLSPLPWTWLNITKSVLSLSLLLVSAVWCGILFHENVSYESVSPTALLSSSSKVITYILVMILMLVHKNRGVTTSTLLTIFWIVFSVCGIILHRSALLQYFILDAKPVSVILALEMMYYPLIYIQLLLSAFTDRKELESLKDGNVMEEVSFLSFVSYSWFNDKYDMETYRGISAGYILDCKNTGFSEKATKGYQKISRLALLSRNYFVHPCGHLLSSLLTPQFSVLATSGKCPGSLLPETY
ncbi:hypothetical protein AVEN_35565-1 [Araneus ventricosus]|uniref:ABC transporter TMD0 domain-containing protein n=1 Tax=Araneus ventricosus TaxID=182803 RepID=A0A4Y2CKW8_ARAVE|nr:hypothetical protein AVEN_35565-1 [Araneus ventricosus]